MKSERNEGWHWTDWDAPRVVPCFVCKKELEAFSAMVRLCVECRHQAWLNAAKTFAGLSAEILNKAMAPNIGVKVLTDAEGEAIANGSRADDRPVWQPVFDAMDVFFCGGWELTGPRWEHVARELSRIKG